MDPIIIIPGIKGTSLENLYEFGLPTTWTAFDAVAGPDIEALRLDPSGRGDLSPFVLNRERQIFPIVYRPLADSLRSRFKVPVYLFPYDWRLSNAVNAERLVEFVTRLQVTLGAAATFNFACHSMGGLVFRSFLGTWTASKAGPLPVNRVVFMATPQLGALDAVEAMIRGETSIFDGRKEMRKLARGFPSVYELLPRFPGAVRRGAATLDIFRERNWQSNVTVAFPDDPEAVTQARLDAARDVLAGLLEPEDVGLGGRALIIYGNKPDSTMTSVNVLAASNGQTNWYDLDNAPHGEGDSLVPVVSATALNIPADAKIEIPFADVRYIAEFAARFGNFHAFFPILDEVRTITARFFNGEPVGTLRPLG